MLIQQCQRYLFALMAIFSVFEASAQGSYPVQEANCESNSDTLFICGVINPEDLYQIPNTEWVIATGRISDSAGPIYAINVESHEVEEIYPHNAALPNFDQVTYQECPGPILTFQPHGVTLRPGAEGGHTLYVVGHGAREAVEVFNLNLDDGVPTLSWTGCIPAPQGTRRINSITALPGGYLGATNFDTTGGQLWEWHPSTDWVEVPGSSMMGPNGLVSSEDGNWFYVGGWSDRALVRVSRGSVPPKVEVIPVGFNVDNVRWGTDGQIIAAGHITRCPNGESCDTSAARVAKVDPESFEVEQLIDYDGNDFFEMGTVAIDVDDEVWIGGIYGSFAIARFPNRD